MQKIAVLLTCFNRKEKTLQSLSSLYAAVKAYPGDLDIQVFLTDDGSSDGTGDAVRANYPEIKVLQGTGSLYWAGGMRNSWNAAREAGGFDGYFLLNDDTNVYDSLWTELFNTHQYCLKNYKRPGVYVGSTIDKVTREISYGGNVFTNRLTARYKRLIPNGETPQMCELGNANIMLVPNTVVQEIGILSEGFIHGMADYDYTLLARKNKIPVLTAPNYLGECTNDDRNPYPNYHSLSLKQRIKFLYSPTGLDFKSNMQYMKRNFPLRVPFVFLAAWFKVLFPRLYASVRPME